MNSKKIVVDEVRFDELEGRNYRYIEFENHTQEIPSCSKSYIETEEEQLSQNRVHVLRQLIPDMQILGDDVTDLLFEFRTLLGL